MRKQTKLVAVLSAAALLAIGASMTSFAATGWTEENGTWVYYDKNGDMVTDTWAKSGNNWFYLDGAGEMAVDQLIEDGDNYYYVDENGAMAANKWVAIDNEDAGNDNEPQQWWYYFQANGKALKGPDDNKVSLKTVNGKKYAFSSEGKMAYGWIKEDDVTIMNDDDDAWQTGTYYFGGENDGAMTVGWKLLDITDADANSEKQHWIAPAFTDDEDQSRWFYFKTNGKKTVGSSDELKESTINGKKYGFDEYGRMVAEWSTATENDASKSTAANSRSWKYFSSVESGARVTKGWFKVVPPKNLNSGDFEDDSEGWYYADNNGKIYAGQLKTIKGKKYAFNEKGKMLSGTRFLNVKGSNILDALANDNEKFPFDTDDNFAENAGKLVAQGYEFYYFGDGDDGSMKTGKLSIDIDGDKYSFNLGKSGSSKGAGKTGEEDKKLYDAGRLMTAGKDEKYQAVVRTRSSVGGVVTYDGFKKFADVDAFANEIYKYGTMTDTEYRGNFVIEYDMSVWNEDNYNSAKIDFFGEEKLLKDVLGLKWSEFKTRTGLSSNSADKYSEVKLYGQYKMNSDDEVTASSIGLSDAVKVINTSGKVSEKASKNKDGNDTYYKLYNGQLVATYVEN